MSWAIIENFACFWIKTLLLAFDWTSKAFCMANHWPSMYGQPTDDCLGGRPRRAPWQIKLNQVVQIANRIVRWWFDQRFLKSSSEFKLIKDYSRRSWEVLRSTRILKDRDRSDLILLDNDVKNRIDCNHWFTW